MELKEKVNELRIRLADALISKVNNDISLDEIERIFYMYRQLQTDEQGNPFAAIAAGLGSSLFSSSQHCGNGEHKTEE